MHYYQFNIKEYRKDTGYLTLLEHGIYRSLIDSYYLNEIPLCADYAKLMRTHGIRTEEEKKAFELVINDFFVLQSDGYHHEKCDEELNRIYSKSEKARESARKRWEKHNKSMRTHSERNANGMLPNNPLPINPLPNKNISVAKAPEQKIGKPKRSDFKNWKTFFDSYPENKKGGTDASAWKAAQREGLDDEDFQLMVVDVETRRKLVPSWYSTYAHGITKYISERMWLTPVTPEIKKVNQEATLEQLTDEDFINGLDPEIARKLFEQPSGNQNGVEAVSARECRGISPGVPQTASKRYD